MADSNRGPELKIRPNIEFLYSFTLFAFQANQMSTKARGEFLASFRQFDLLAECFLHSNILSELLADGLLMVVETIIL